MTDLRVKEGGEVRRIGIRVAEGPLAEAHVSLSLGLEEYRAACDAHRDGQPVRVRGRLERSGRSWELRDATDFVAAT